MDLKVDAGLLQLCRKHDRRAQYELYRKCYSFLMSICSRYERNKEDAEALLNQSFLKILLNIGKYSEEIPLALWMRKITVNTIIDEYRKVKKHKEITSSIDLNTNYPAHYDINEYIKRTDAEEILRMIDKLPEMSRNVFNMYSIDGFSHKEIAKLLSIPEGTSRWHLNLAKTELKKNFLKNNITPNIPA